MWGRPEPARTKVDRGVGSNGCALRHRHSAARRYTASRCRFNGVSRAFGPAPLDPAHCPVTYLSRIKRSYWGRQMRIQAGIGAIALVALFAVSPASARGHSGRQHCDTYTNSSGRRVCRPIHASHAPPGAKAKCRDGTYSFSEHRRGSCSDQGALARWL